MNKYLKLLPLLFLALFLVACSTPDLVEDTPNMPSENDSNGTMEEDVDDGLNNEFVDEDEDINIGEPV